MNGSNDWVVSGAHTVTGKPLLSNDMHLGHQMPNLWYEAHLKAGALDVAGVTLPGMPYVIVGHNQRIAWGFTNVGPTVADAFIENFNAQGAYQTPQGWQQPEHRQEVIHVKGQPDITLDVKITRHGPIVTDILPGETRQVALRWTLYDGLHMPFFDVDSAQNWEEFRKAFSQLDAPGQNVVYADVDGNIGYQTTGHVPIRAAGDGSLPVSGADDAHEWTSYIPFDKLPSIYNPPSGVIATANGRITPDGYPYSISAEWEAPWRTERIYHVLESGRKFAASDMLGLQNDVHSESDLFAAERFVYAIDHSSRPSARAKQAAELMRNWDGRMVASSTPAAIAVRSSRELSRLLLEPHLGAAPDDPKKQTETLSWKTYDWEMRSVWLQNILLHQPKRWLPEKYSNYDELLTAAVDSAVNGSDAPKDLASWHWGNINAIEIDHPVLGKIPLVRRSSAPGINEQSGSSYTVKAVTRHHGPSERFTANLADLDQSTLNTVTGQGGNFLSPYYMDQWKAWYEGSTFTLPFSSPAVQSTAAHRLVLEPKNSFSEQNSEQHRSLEEVDRFHVDNLARHDDGSGSDEAVQQQTVNSRVINTQSAALGYVFHIAGGKALQTGCIPIVRRYDNIPVGGVVDRQTTAHLSRRRIHVADVRAGMRADEKLAIVTHIDAIVIAIGDCNGAGHGHRAEIENVEASASFCGGRLAGARIVGQGVSNHIECRATQERDGCAIDRDRGSQS